MERTHYLPGVKAPQALDAAAQVLQLAGGNEMQLQRDPDGLTAELHRQTTIYLFLVAHRSEVWDRWRIVTQPSGDGI